VHVRLAGRSYNIHIGAGLLAESGVIAREAGLDGNAVVIVDKRIADRYGAQVLASLRSADFSAALLQVPSGERSKSLRQAEKLFEAMIELGLDRRAWVAAVGGGVVGDLAGFVAATFMRGIAYVQVPTSLLAQVDSSVGGKTAVNLKAGKNLVGAFHQPRVVISDINVLQTLPRREISAGLAEVIKHGLIADPRLLTFVKEHAKAVMSFDPLLLAHLIQRSCEIKGEVVQQDEREQGLRRVLNCGHTVGHGIETVGRPRRLRHGEAVALGLLAEMRIAQQLGLSAESDRTELVEVLRAVHLPVALPGLEADAVMAAMGADKKATGGRWVMALPEGLGRVRIVEDVPRRLVQESLVELADRP